MVANELTPIIRIGDRVTYAGTGASVLDGGPGEVIALRGGMARVKVLTPCRVLHDDVKAGEVFVFNSANLKRQLAP